MPPSSKPLPPSAVVPCNCIAMTVALEVVAEHRKTRAQADLRDEAELAQRRAGRKTAGKR